VEKCFGGPCQETVRVRIAAEPRPLSLESSSPAPRGL
jgi:hypothetical protein